LHACRAMVYRGPCPSAFQAMLLGSGIPQEVVIWDMGLTGPGRTGKSLINPKRVRAWNKGHDCIWREHGVWDLDGNGQPRLLRPNHFVEVGGHKVDFSDDYLLPFLQRYAHEIRSVHPNAIIFLEAPPTYAPPRWDPEALPRTVHAAHWYDGFTLFLKRYLSFMGIDLNTGRFVFGRKRVRRAFARQVARIKAEATDRMGGIPSLIGEFGIPFDLQDKRAYRSGDFGQQIQAMDDTFQAIEASLLSGTLWNYTADNDNRHGDQWNGEDLSIFSRDQQSDAGDLNSGGRALEAVVRPYARRIAGEPLQMAFDLKRRAFEFSFRHDPGVDAPTEIYVPDIQYPGGYEVEVSDGQHEMDQAGQILLYRHGTEREVHRIRIRPALYLLNKPG